MKTTAAPDVIQVPRQYKRLLRQAAEIGGVTLSQFVTRAAVIEAEAVVAAAGSPRRRRGMHELMKIDTSELNRIVRGDDA